MHVQVTWEYLIDQKINPSITMDRLLHYAKLNATCSMICVNALACVHNILTGKIMDRQFEAHLKKKNVDKKTIKALKKESITTTDVLKQCTDADIESMCVEHKLGVAAKVALRQIRDELKLTSGNVSMAELDRPMFDRCVVAIGSSTL